MKFRMAENSLFAILLRSPWWASLALALLIALLARLALPDDLVVVGALGGLPFLVISVLALRRQWREPAKAEIQRTADAVAAMGWPAFADRLEEVWRRQGYEVVRRDGPDGRGADFELRRAGAVTLVSARRWKAANLGVEPLRELHAAMERAGAGSGLCIALGTASTQAAGFARENRITLVDAVGLARLKLATGPVS